MPGTVVDTGQSAVNKTESLPSWCLHSSGIRPSVKIILMKYTICQVVIDVRKHQDKRIVIEVWPFKWGDQERTY